MFGTKDIDTEKTSKTIGIGSDSGLKIGKTPLEQQNAFPSLTNEINRVRIGENTHLNFTQLERNISCK